MVARSRILIASAIALLALAIPALAQAQPIATNSEGEAATEIEAVSTNTTVTTTAGVIVCGTVRWTMIPTTNTTTTFHALFVATAVGNKLTPHEGECELVPTGLKVKVTFLGETIHLEPGFGTWRYRLKYDITLPTGIRECNLEGEPEINYSEGSDVLSVQGSLVGSGTSCPTAAEITGDFTTTENGEPVLFN